MYSRAAEEAEIREALLNAPIVCILGPRQCGKSTLARQIAAATPSSFFDLEDPRDLRRLEQPMTALEGLRGLVVLDEVQRLPQLFPVLRVLADRTDSPAQFLLLGSASSELIEGSSESLAGRIRFVEMSGFSVAEVGAGAWRDLHLRGGLPRSFLARSDRESLKWRDDFARTFVERDIFRGLPEMKSRRDPAQIRRLWTMMAHRHAQLLNTSDLASSLGISSLHVSQYLGLLTGALVVRQLPPWHSNTEKRVVKSPKMYIRDSGMLHALLGLRTRDELESHPALGASFEGFALEEIIRVAGERNVYFWRTHGGAELDVLVNYGTKRIGFEIKWADAPATTKSMHSALRDLDLDALFVLYPGADSWPMMSRTWAWPVTDVPGAFRSLVG